jgi:hypothetical protein
MLFAPMAGLGKLFNRKQAGANFFGSADVLPAGAVAFNEVVYPLFIELIVAHFAARRSVGVLDPFLMVAAVTGAQRAGLIGLRLKEKAITAHVVENRWTVFLG